MGFPVGENDPPTIILVIVTITLALLALGSLAGGLVMSLRDKSVPDFIIALGAGAAGTLSGILVPSSRGR